MRIILVGLLQLLFACGNPQKNNCIEGNCENGIGVLQHIFYSDTEYYRGQFKNGMLVDGRYEPSHGEWKEGTFINGATMQGKGKIKLPDGVYEGEFIDGLEEGIFTVTHNDSSTEQREYHEGKLVRILENATTDPVLTAVANSTEAPVTVSSTTGHQPVVMQLKFLAYSETMPATDYSAASFKEVNAVGSITINEKTKKCNISYADKNQQLDIQERSTKGSSVFYYCMGQAVKGIATMYLMQYDKSMNFFTLSLLDSYRYNYYEHGLNTNEFKLNIKKFELAD